MSRVLHPRPNPIVASMYTLRDLDADVIVMHGPSGCGFMASRMLEEAGVRVVTTAMDETGLIFGATDSLQDVIREVDGLFSPQRIGVVGTCASMIIGEDFNAVHLEGVDAPVLFVDVHGCMGDNTEGAVRTMEAASKAGIIDGRELERQKRLLRSATAMERRGGMAKGGYITPSRGPTKYAVAKRIADVLSAGGRVDVVMNAKKELGYRFADINAAVQEAAEALGGEAGHIMNIDTGAGLPRIRRYARDIEACMEAAGIDPDISGGLDEYAVTGERTKALLEGRDSDLLVFTGVPHAYDPLDADDVLVTDQPRILAHLLQRGHRAAVGEIASHSLVMGASEVIPSETGDTIRQLLSDREA